MLTLPLGAFPLTFHVDGMTLKKDGQPDCALFNPVQLGLQRLAEIERRKAERALNSSWVLEDGEEIVNLMTGEFRAQFQKLRRTPNYVVRYDGDSKRCWDEICARVEELTAQDGRPGSLTALRAAIVHQNMRGDVMSVSPPPQRVPRRAASIDYIEISSDDEIQGVEQQKPNPNPPSRAPKRRDVKIRQGAPARVKIEADSSSSSESDSGSNDEGPRQGKGRLLRPSVAYPQSSRRPISQKQSNPSNNDRSDTMEDFLKRRHRESPNKCTRCINNGYKCFILADKPLPGRACIKCRSMHLACSLSVKLS